MAYTVTPMFLCCVLRLLSWLGQSLFGEHYLREALSTHGAELRLPGLAGLKDRVTVLHRQDGMAPRKQS